jgi:hypothetical protein
VDIDRAKPAPLISLVPSPDRGRSSAKADTDPISQGRAT